MRTFVFFIIENLYFINAVMSGYQPFVRFNKLHGARHSLD